MILVAGDIMLDVLLLSELKAEEQSRGIMVRPGGSAANTAAWLGHLGCPVTFAGCVGDDAAGAMFVEELSGHGVRCAVRRVADIETGAVAVEIGDDGERLMRSARGANEAFSPDDLRRAAGPGLTAVHLTGYALLGPDGLAMLEETAEIARAAGACLSFDPSSCGVIHRLGARGLIDVIRRTDVGLLLPNFPEAAALTGEVTAEAAAAALARIAPAVVVKDAAGGAVWGDGLRTERVSATPVAPVDTTGAGDAFDAGVLCALDQGASLSEACSAGNAVAGKAIRAYGGRPQPTRGATALPPDARPQ